jgi:hypothetical protein
LLPKLRKIRAAGTVCEWPAWVHEQNRRIAGRVCALRKSEQAIALAQRRITLQDQKRQRQSRPETREYARYVIVFTTVRESEMGAAEVLEYYRFRWQIELVFKRLKSILAMGHLPKYDDQSSRAWLYGKLLVALLTQKLVHLGSAFSPWGYDLWPPTGTQPLA